MSTKTKRRIINWLTWFNSTGLIIIAVLLIVLIGRVAKNQTANHNDTANAVEQLKTDSALNQKVIICMLKVLPAQRTADLEQQCRLDAQKEK